jgi:flagellar basal-body rod protein FlgF
MTTGLYVAMSAGSARTKQLDAVADALANVSTPGYRPNRSAMATFELPGTDGSVAYVAAVGGGADERPGLQQNTGRALDVAPEGNAWFSVQMPDGSAGYTRAGRMELDAQGTLRTAGLPVLGTDGGAIQVAPNAGNVDIGPDGTVRVAGRSVASLALVTPQGPLTAVGPHVVRADSAVTDANARVRPGTLEMGPADAVTATVEMVAAQRHFESAMQAIQAYRRLSQASSEAGRVR